MKLKCNAKINIGLNIAGITDDGYHSLDMVMCPVTLFDKITITINSDKEDKVVFVNQYVPTNNTVTKAISLLRNKRQFKQYFNVVIKKEIPSLAGLGGGSADAAYVLRAINTMLNLKLSKQELKDIALEVGADVPFFIDNVPARCKNKGEILSPITIKNNYYVLLIIPPIGVDTKQAYKDYDTIKSEEVDIDTIIKSLEEGDDILLKNNVNNSLLGAALLQAPEINDIFNSLKQYNVICSMSGSGSAVYALSSKKRVLRKIRKQFKKKYKTFICKLWR